MALLLVHLAPVTLSVSLSDSNWNLPTPIVDSCPCWNYILSFCGILYVPAILSHTFAKKQFPKQDKCNCAWISTHFSTREICGGGRKLAPTLALLPSSPYPYFMYADTYFPKLRKITLQDTTHLVKSLSDIEKHIPLLRSFERFPVLPYYIHANIAKAR